MASKSVLISGQRFYSVPQLAARWGCSLMTVGRRVKKAGSAVRSTIHPLGDKRRRFYNAADIHAIEGAFVSATQKEQDHVE